MFVVHVHISYHAITLIYKLHFINRFK